MNIVFFLKIVNIILKKQSNLRNLLGNFKIRNCRDYSFRPYELLYPLLGDDCMTADNTVERRDGATYDPPMCMTAAPRDVWANHDVQGSSYEARACCVPGASETGQTGCAKPTPPPPPVEESRASGVQLVLTAGWGSLFLNLLFE